MDYTTPVNFTNAEISSYTSKLGRGISGVVTAVTDSNGNEFAAKSTKLSKGLQALIREYTTLATIQHPNIMKIDDISSNFKNGTSRGVLLMEKMDGDLTDLFGICGLYESFRSIFSQILEGISALHSFGYSHRDIKTSNILYKKYGKKYIIKIADFGLARPLRADGEFFTAEVCTPAYRPPELHSENPDEDKNIYDSKIDVFAAGVVFLELIIGGYAFVNPYKHPYQEMSKVIKLDSSKYRNHPLNDHQGVKGYLTERNLVIDELLVDLLERMLECESSQRISAEEALQHSYFYQTNSSYSPTKRVKLDGFQSPEPTMKFLTIPSYPVHRQNDLEADAALYLIKEICKKYKLSIITMEDSERCFKTYLNLEPNLVSSDNIKLVALACVVVMSNIHDFYPMDYTGACKLYNYGTSLELGNCIIRILSITGGLLLDLWSSWCVYC